MQKNLHTGSTQFLKKIHFSAVNVVDRADDPQALRLLHAVDLQAVLNKFDAVPHVQAAGLIIVLFPADGKFDLVGDEFDVALRITVDGGIHRAAARVTQYQDQRRTQMGGGIFNAPQLVVVDHVPRHADHEKLAQPGGKYALRDHPGVGAADDNGVGGLPVGGGVKPQPGGNVTGAAFRGQVTFIARFQPLQNLRC